MTYVFVIASPDYLAYEQLLHRDVEEKETAKASQTIQERHDVQKQIFVFDGKERLQTRLDCLESHLVFGKEEKAVKEYMRDVKGLMQEKILNKDPGQAQQYLIAIEADKALYYYDKKELEADKIHLQRYVLLGKGFSTLFPEDKPLMVGVLRDVKIGVDSSGIKLKANQLHSQLNERL